MSEEMSRLVLAAATLMLSILGFVYAIYRAIYSELTKKLDEHTATIHEHAIENAKLESELKNQSRRLRKMEDTLL